MQEAETRYFTGPSMRAVLADVRDALGKDALIVSEEQSNGRVRVGATGPVRLSLVEAVQAPPVPKTAYRSALKALGYSEAFLERLPEQAREFSEFGRWIAGELNVVERLPATGVYRVVGPHGAGKTSLLINWAAEHVRAHPHTPIHLVTTDTDRLAGTAALDRAGELLGVPVTHVEAAALEGILHQLEGLVLVDTRSGARQPACQAKDILVLPSHADADTLWAVKRNPPSAIILTHTDHARRLGGPFSLLAESGIPLLALGISGEVPGGMGRCSVDRLQRLAVVGIEDS